MSSFMRYGASVKNEGYSARRLQVNLTGGNCFFIAFHWQKIASCLKVI